MTIWNRDMSTAPQDVPVWLATACGKVIKSYWVEPAKPTAEGRWAGVNAPIAWQLFVVPAHPGAVPVADVATASEAEWISWPGGEKPDLEDEVVVQVECRDADRCVGSVGGFWWKHSEPSDPEHRCDILRYRVAHVDVAAVHFMTALDSVGGGL